MIKHLKKVTIASLVTLVTALPSHAAGVFDGIYVNLSSGGESYLSLHTNGQNVVATVYGIIPASGIVMSSILGNIYPRQINTWELYLGTISGSTANLTGQTLYNACHLTIRATFTEGSATAQIIDASNTLVGNASNINCSLYKTAIPGGVLRYTKLF